MQGETAIRLLGQRGAALLGVLMILLVLTLLAGSAFLTSLTERSIAANHEAALKAAYAAEAGLQDLLHHFRNRPNLYLQKTPLDELGFPLFDSTNASCGRSSFCLERLAYEPVDPPGYVLAVMVGVSGGHKGLSRVQGVIQGTALGGTFPAPYPFRLGLVTAGRLDIRDCPRIEGDLHGHRGFSVTPDSVRQYLQENGYSLSQGTEPLRPDFRRMPDIPRMTEDRFLEYREAAKNPPHQQFSGSRSMTLKGDQGGKLIFIEGDLQLRCEELSGITVVVTGKLILEGNTIHKAGGDLDLAFLSGADTIVRPQREINGVFWTGGSFSASGPGKIRGAVISRGDLLLTGGVAFERESRLSPAFLRPLSPTVSFHLSGWAQR